MRSAGAVVVVLLGLAACASAGRAPAARRPASPAIADSLPEMTSAPYAQKFVWVAPSAIFAGVTARDDSAGDWGPTAGLKRSVAVPLADGPFPSGEDAGGGPVPGVCHSACE